MKVHIKHPSGAEFHGPNRLAGEWWSRFSKATPEVEPDEQEEQPKVIGADGGASGAVISRYDSWNGYTVTPKVFAFGFVRNEENE